MNDLISLDLVSTVDLSENNNLYQFVYASQLYGTTFAVFANFEIAYVDKETREIKNINLRLINYKGLINIGFKEKYCTITKPQLTKVLLDSDENEIKRETIRWEISFDVKALSSEDKCTYMKSGIDPLDFYVKHGDRIIISRFLTPMHDKFIPFEYHPDIYQSPEVVSEIALIKGNKEVFDEEFFYRDGLTSGTEKMKEGMKFLDDSEEEESLLESAHIIPSIRCHQSELNIAIY